MVSLPLQIRGPKTTYFRRFRNFTATLTAYSRCSPSSCYDRGPVVDISHGVFHVVLQPSFSTTFIFSKSFPPQPSAPSSGWSGIWPLVVWQSLAAIVYEESGTYCFNVSRSHLFSVDSSRVRSQSIIHTKNSQIMKSIQSNPIQSNPMSSDGRILTIVHSDTNW